LRILFVGDIFGAPGRTALHDHLADQARHHSIDLILANCENSAAGFGITPRLADELFSLGIAAMTTGNHAWDKKEILDHFPKEPRLVRAMNYPAWPGGGPPGAAPGSGVYFGRSKTGVPYALMHAQGRVFMNPLDCPFHRMDEELAKLPESCKIRILDFHAEATSEKQAIGWYLDGRVTAVIGTHTHVPTADERVLPGGTAFITDVGMTGPYASVIGVDRDLAIKKFLNQMPVRYIPAKEDVRLCGVIIDADEDTGHARSITRLELRVS
jgi:2',3'-cyclic-nucleotide 2'-phosphodiesterase